MDKITLMLTFEIDTAGVTEEVLHRAWGCHNNYQELLADPESLAMADSQRRMASALLARPALMEEYLRARLAGYLESRTSTDFNQLTGARRETVDILQELIGTLPEPDQAYFGQAVEQEVLWENTDLVHYSFEPQRPTLVIAAGGLPVKPAG